MAEKNNTVKTIHQKQPIDANQRLAGSEQIAPEKKALPDLIYLSERFNAKAMSEHDVLLGMAGRALNAAYGASYAISGIARILKRNLIASDFDEEILKGCEDDQLLCALVVLSEGINDRLCNAAESIEKRMKEDK